MVHPPPPFATMLRELNAYGTVAPAPTAPLVFTMPSGQTAQPEFHRGRNLPIAVNSNDNGVTFTPYQSRPKPDFSFIPRRRLKSPRDLCSLPCGRSSQSVSRRSGNRSFGSSHRRRMESHLTMQHSAAPQRRHAIHFRSSVSCHARETPGINQHVPHRGHSTASRSRRMPQKVHT